MCTGVGVGWCAFGSELEYGPSAPAESDGGELREAVVLLQGFGAALDFGEAKVFGVASEEFFVVEVAGFQCLRIDDLAVEAVEMCA